MAVIAHEVELTPTHTVLLAYWGARRGGRAMPARADLDPAAPEIRGVLPYLLLVDVRAEPWRFRWRLAGTAVVEAFGSALTGLAVEEAATPLVDRAHLLRAMSRSVETRRPVYAESPFVTPRHRLHVPVRRILLPLSSDGLAVDMLVGAQTLGPASRLPGIDGEPREARVVVLD